MSSSSSSSRKEEEAGDKEKKKIIHISSRKSALALIQTNQVWGMLTALFPSINFVINHLHATLGDQVQDVHLCDIERKKGENFSSFGLFTKGLELDLLSKKSRLAVHSLKDMPTKLPPGLMLGCVLKRESPEDCVIFHPKYKALGITNLEGLPDGAIVGTSSLRRESLTRRLYPTLGIKTIRGNIQTRLKKLQDSDEYDAIIVAAVGFRRGGLEDHIGQILDPSVFGYGVGQGSIGIECCEDDEEILNFLKNIEHEQSAQSCKAERSLLNTIEGGCQISMGVNTTIKGDVLTLSATLLSRDGSEAITESVSGNRFDAVKLGKTLAGKFLANDQAVILLGPRGVEKRALTYGDAEAPGAALADALKKQKTLE